MWQCGERRPSLFETVFLKARLSHRAIPKQQCRNERQRPYLLLEERVCFSLHELRRRVRPVSGMIAHRPLHMVG